MLLEQTYCFLLLCLLLVHDLPQLLRHVRHINMRNTQRVSNCIRNCRGGADSTGLTNTLDTKGVHRGQGNSALSLKIRKLCSEGHGIIRQSCCQKLSILTIDSSLIPGLTNALRKTTMNLTLNWQW